VEVLEVQEVLEQVLVQLREVLQQIHPEQHPEQVVEVLEVQEVLGLQDLQAHDQVPEEQVDRALEQLLEQLLVLVLVLLLGVLQLRAQDRQVEQVVRVALVLQVHDQVPEEQVELLKLHEEQQQHEGVHPRQKAVNHQHQALHPMETQMEQLLGIPEQMEILSKQKLIHTKIITEVLIPETEMFQ